MGDRVRNIPGHFYPNGSKTNYLHWWGWGAFDVRGEGTHSFGKMTGVAEAAPDYQMHLNPSRVVPTGAANMPRSWGSLACAYFGQPSLA